MSDSKLESRAVGPSPQLSGATASSPQLSGEKLAELLSAISEAPDFVTAATFMIAQFADILGARRGLAITLDSPPNRLIATAAVGFDGEPVPSISLSTNDLSNPVVVSALSLHAVSCPGNPPIPGLPFGEWTAIPFPQPQFRGAPPLLTDPELELVQLVGCEV